MAVGLKARMKKNQIVFDKEHKYKAKPTKVDNIFFDSTREAERYGELKLLARAGDIADLEVHPVFPIVINNRSICKVELDFRYTTETGEIFIEDVKGAATALSSLKRKLVEAVHGITVEIIK